MDRLGGHRRTRPRIAGVHRRPVAPAARLPGAASQPLPERCQLQRLRRQGPHLADADGRGDGRAAMERPADPLVRRAARRPGAALVGAGRGRRRERAAGLQCVARSDSVQAAGGTRRRRLASADRHGQCRRRARGDRHLRRIHRHRPVGAGLHRSTDPVGAGLRS
ncbi:hypothetical protein VARIO8X_150152 [Burkholderiales bacterium 8X]|nr:hypothetical protein VARIO8X_150152 [Burkholderiales bacterium 8X]